MFFQSLIDREIEIPFPPGEVMRLPVMLAFEIRLALAVPENDHASSIPSVPVPLIVLLDTVGENVAFAGGGPTSNAFPETLADMKMPRPPTVEMVFPLIVGESVPWAVSDTDSEALLMSMPSRPAFVMLFPVIVGVPVTCAFVEALRLIRKWIPSLEVPSIVLLVTAGVAVAVALLEAEILTLTESPLPEVTVVMEF